MHRLTIGIPESISEKVTGFAVLEISVEHQRVFVKWCSTTALNKKMQALDNEVRCHEKKNFVLK